MINTNLDRYMALIGEGKAKPFKAKVLKEYKTWWVTEQLKSESCVKLLSDISDELINLALSPNYIYVVKQMPSLEVSQLMEYYFTELGYTVHTVRNNAGPGGDIYTIKISLL